MFSRDGRGEMKAPVTPVAATKAAAATTAAATTAAATAASDARRNANRSRMPSPIAGGGGLSRTLSTPPIAESTHIGSFSPGPSSGSSNKHPGALGRGGSVRGDLWNGTGNISIGNTSGQFKRKPTSPLSNSRTLFKSSGNLSIFGRANSQIFTDAQSPGLVNRLVRYSERSAQSGGAMNRSQSLSSVYSKPGQFPVVHLRKQELRYGLGGGASHLGSGSSGGIRRRGGNFSAIRIPPPDMSLFQVNKRSSILRTGSLLIPASAETHETSTTGGNSSSSSSTTTLFGGGGRGVKSSTNEADAMENRVITPCAELEATPTRSVLDALKEISRKRINSEELDADRIKKQCKELSELDSAGSGPPSSSSTGAVATGTFGLATKRSRDPGSPSSPSTLDGGAGGSGASGTTVAVGSSGSYLGLGGLAPGELQVSKKRFCSKNNDILSSLSSSISSSHTPNRYRIAVPRMDHRLAMVGSPSISFSNSSILGSMPSTSSTPIAEAIQELAAKELATRNDRETAASQRAIKSASYAQQQQQQQQPSWKQKTPPSERPTVSEPQGRTQPKITLFNRPYETSTTKKLPVSSLATTTSDGEEDEHGESSGRVQFVKPKERMSPLGVKSGASGGVGGAAGTGSNSDPLKKPPASKLSVMLKCLSGDLGEEDEEEEEEDEEQQQQQAVRESPKTPKPKPQATQAVAPSGLPKSSFTFGGLASAKDTVDATSKITGASTEATKTTSKDETVAKGPSTVGSGIAALINNPIKDAGLGKIVQPEIKETSGPAAEKPKSAAPAAAASTPAVAFTFGIPAATTSSGAAATTVSNTTNTANKTTLTSATFKAPEGGAAAALPSAPAAPFTFGTPLKQPASSSTASSSTVTSPSTNFISFSPAPTAPTAAAAAAASGFGGTTFGGAFAKAASPVVQFGAGNAAATTSTTASGTEKTTAAAPIFSFGAASSPAASVATSSTIASPSSVPSFGAGSTFSAFKSPAAPAVPAAPAGTPTAPAAATFSFGSVATASSASTAASSTTSSSSSILPPVFGSLSSGNTASTAAPAAPTPGSTFTFGSALKTSSATSATPAATTAAPATGAFTFGAAALAPTTTAASAPAAAAPASSTTTSTFPTFGGTTTPQQPFTFGGAAAGAPAAPTNLFASATANNNNTSNTPATATTNLFGATLASSPKTTTESSASSAAASPNLFGTPAQPSAPASGSVFGRLAPAATSATGTNGANSNSNTPAAPGVFSFGAVKPSTGTPSAGGSVAAAPSLATNGQNIFGAAAAQSGAPGGGVTGGLFTFGATQQNTAQSQAPQNATGGVPTFGSGLPSSNPLAGQPTAVPANKPFTFGSTAAAKPPTAVGVSASPSPAQTATPGTGIFGQPQQQQQQQAPSPFGASSQQQPSVPAFGSPVFGGTAGATNTAAPAQTTGTIFGQAAQVNGGTTNGPNTSGNLFTFGAKTPVASSTPAVGTTFGAPANSNTFGSVATGGLSNGLGQQQQQQQQQQTNKPFTFGAQASAPTAVTAQPGQVQATSTGGFNFNLGSNVAPVAKPFSFTAGAANSAASPPVFGAPAAVAPTVNAGSPFTFGAAANNNNNAGIGQPASNASAAPFTFGSTQQPQQQQQPNAASPFSFSAGNVATVAPQPQQHQQQQQPGVAAPFTFNAGGGGGGAFGAAPVFGAPAGIPTFSIGTSSTPNGPTAGQRRIKTATRRIK